MIAYTRTTFFGRLQRSGQGQRRPAVHSQGRLRRNRAVADHTQSDITIQRHIRSDVQFNTGRTGGNVQQSLTVVHRTVVQAQSMGGFHFDCTLIQQGGCRESGTIHVYVGILGNFIGASSADMSPRGEIQGYRVIVNSECLTISNGHNSPTGKVYCAAAGAYARIICQNRGIADIQCAVGQEVYHPIWAIVGV